MSKEIDGLVVKLPAKKWNWQYSDFSKKVLFLSATVGIVRLWEWVHGLIDGLLFNQELKHMESGLFCWLFVTSEQDAKT